MNHPLLRHRHMPLLVASLLTFFLVFSIIAMSQRVINTTHATWTAPLPTKAVIRRPRPTHVLPPSDYNHDGRLDEWDLAVLHGDNH